MRPLSTLRAAFFLNPTFTLVNWPGAVDQQLAVLDASDDLKYCLVPGAPRGICNAWLEGRDAHYSYG
ncbi:MAG: hypothetical protein IPL77_21780 [Flavobacteriales bacterium]|nr:hypothetical protein [Flavobacteriales bacterium]